MLLHETNGTQFWPSSPILPFNPTDSLYLDHSFSNKQDCTLLYASSTTRHRQ